MSSYIGIDLGTTFSVVATIDEHGRPQIVENQSNPDGSKNITPSCIRIKGGDLKVGWGPYKVFDFDENVVGRFKRDMGSSKVFSIDGKDYTPTDLSVAVLNELKKVAEAGLGDISEAVVTVPANFANEAREATLEAARRAGLEVKYIINEPTAAALYYAFKMKDKGEELSGCYAVYDLGGGTFDISIISISGQDVEVRASNGIHKLGGHDFDEALINIVRGKYGELTGKELDKEDYKWTDSERDKHSLSAKPRTVAGGGEEIAGELIGVKRSEFEETISSLIAQTEMVCQLTVEEAGLKISDIKGVFLAGGSTRIPAVLRSVERVFGQEPISEVNVDEVVALGAALYAAYKSDGKHLSPAQRYSVESIKFSEVTNHYYGTTALTYNESRDEEGFENVILIKKGEKIPCSVKKPFYTVSDGQEGVHCEVTQCTIPEKDLSFVNKVWEGVLPLPPGRLAGQEIEITFSYDENQVMKCSFKDVESGKVKETQLKMGADANNESSEIDKFLVD